MIKLNNVSYTYMSGGPFEAAAVENVTAIINSGEFVGLMGHTGSGKSTLVQHFNQHLTPPSSEQ